MEIQDYMPRLMDDILQQNLSLYGALSLEGCKWCGKSTTARRAAKSLIELQNSETVENSRALANSDPQILLTGEKPRLIDEWQDAPALWDAVRYDVDKSGLAGQYILTGSVTPKKNRPRHSGTGRIVKVTMRPMSLFESKDSSGEVSLGALFSGKEKVSGSSELNAANIARLCVRGGWPLSVRREKQGVKLQRADTGKIARDYLESILGENTRSSDNDDISFSVPKMRLVIRSIARNIATPLTLRTIISDVEASGETISDKTLASYLDILTRIHFLDDIEPWSPRLRSKTTVRAGYKRNFSDPSLVAAAMLATENDLRADYHTFGLVFESLALRDLNVYAESLNGRLYYYRDKAGRESDAVIHMPDGKWCAIEIKLGSDEASIEAGASALAKFLSNIDTEVMNPPAFLMVLTAATNYAYRRKDGIYVVPIGCLRN